MARYALVIGIAEYLSPSLPRLSKTINDAEAIAQLLEQYGDFQSVQRLPQRWNKDKNGYEMAASKVTGAEIGQELRKLLLEQATNNEVLIYFSGHGFITSDTLGQQEGFLATSDCQVEVKGNQIVAQKYGISLNKLNKLIGESQLSSLVVLLDCCHSGYFLERELVEQTLTAFRSLKDYYLIAACRRFEKAAAIMSEEYSIFTGAVIKGLAAENAGSSGRISSDRLFDFVSNQLIGSIQEPIRMSLGRPITLVNYPQLNLLKEEIAFNQENPYRGLDAFESEQAQYFCGRDEAVRTLVSRLAESRFLAIIGYSGSGKSSLVKAGVLPQLKSDRLPGSSKWKIISFTPGEHPYGKLVDILVGQQQQNQPHILFIDQFEEIFTLCQDDEERKSFIRLVAEEVKTIERQTRIILTIRGDFLKRCNDYLEIITLINSVPPTTFIVPPMSFAELEEAIAKPAKLHGVNFEHGLVSQITNDVVTRPGALPILQYALKELWRVCIEEPELPQQLLTRKAYEEIGAVKGALDKRATILYQNLPTLEDQAFARSLFMELVHLGETGEVTRRRATWKKLEAIADSPQQLQRVVESLAGSGGRLIITDKDTVEVAHEALLSEWKLLNTWIAENLENIRLSRSLEEDCQEWIERFNQSDDALLAGAKLAVISEWFDRNQPKLPPLESEFLRKSLQRRDRQNQAELEQAKKLQQQAEAKAKAESQRTRFAIASATLIVLSLGLGFFAWRLRTENKVKDAIASTALTSTPKLLLDAGSQLEAVIESVKALKQLQDIGVENTNTINKFKLVIDGVQERNRLEGHTDSVTSVSVSPKDSLIVSGSKDTTVRLWKLDGTPVKTPAPMKHDTPVRSVHFSPDGKYIVSGGDDKIIKLWKKDGTFIDSAKEDENGILFVNFSPDSKTIISTSYNGTVTLWNIDNISSKLLKPSHILSPKNGNYAVWSAEFSHDGQMIITANDDGNIKILGKDGKNITTFKVSDASVSYAIFGLNNDTIISSSYDNTIRMWRKNDNQIWSNVETVKANTPYQVKFSPDYRMIAATSIDGNIQLWKNEQLTQKYYLIGRHRDKINALSFSNDNKWIVTASRDQTLRIWSLDSQSENITQTNTASLLKKSCSWLSDYLNNNVQARKKYFDARQICENAKTTW
ncbi:nSTAND1 domain-containing NTPase [Nostoc sp.]|uniref:nSTAND1 domain-containing NTPase n=1 Tax=Nostoc sp. TaxID=1180 RepID=UPI002FF47D86